MVLIHIALSLYAVSPRQLFAFMVNKVELHFSAAKLYDVTACSYWHK